jgi:hypothetical protein
MHLHREPLRMHPSYGCPVIGIAGSETRGHGSWPRVCLISQCGWLCRCPRASPAGSFSSAAVADYPANLASSGTNSAAFTVPTPSTRL